jgi:hypothetical protein
MSKIQPIRTIQSAAESYVESRRNGRPISALDAVRALRTLMADCPLTDREIVDLVARAAIRRRMIMNFDGPDLPPGPNIEFEPKQSAQR